jgi:hypothetical protein
MPSEQKWYALTGRVVGLKVEADGDIHITLQDATGNGVGTVSAEIPVGPKWCEIRQTVFDWTTQSFGAARLSPGSGVGSVFPGMGLSKNSFLPNHVQHPLHGVHGRNSGSFSTAARRVAIS